MFPWSFQLAQVNVHNGYWKILGSEMGRRRYLLGYILPEMYTTGGGGARGVTGGRGSGELVTGVTLIFEYSTHSSSPEPHTPQCLYTNCMYKLFISDSCSLQLIKQYNTLKVHNVFLKVTFPPWLHPVKIWLHTVSGSWRKHETFK